MPQLWRRVRAAAALAVLAAGAAACSREPDPFADVRRNRVGDTVAATTTPPPPKGVFILTPARGASVKGNVVNLELDVDGIRIVPPDGDTSGETGHFHVFVDKEPVNVGDVIPRGPDIIHSTANPLPVPGLGVGQHQLFVVVGDGNHARLPNLAAVTTVTVEGPSVLASAPATVPAGQPVRLELSAEGVEIVRADGDTSFQRGHYHVFVDRDPTAPGETVPPAPPDGSILHTADASVQLPPLAPGEHTIWVVLGNGAHVASAPPVQDRLTVTVTTG